MGPTVGDRLLGEMEGLGEVGIDVLGPCVGELVLVGEEVVGAGEIRLVGEEVVGSALGTDVGNSEGLEVG